jgi:membrane protease YdiL (CAAX protease family)
MTQHDTPPAPVAIAAAPASLPPGGDAPVETTRPMWIKVMRNPVVRIIVFLVFAAGLGYAAHFLLPGGGKDPQNALGYGGSDLLFHLLRGVLVSGIAYLLLVRVVEGRRVHELRPRNALLDIAKGWLLGTVILVLAAGAMLAAGVIEFSAATVPADLIAPLVVLGLVPGVSEEIITRGVLFRVVEDGLGTWWALALSALFFGGAHIANPNATLWTSAAIAIEAGLLLGMAYAWTRSLWFVFALHAAWNFTQGALLGIPVSGMDVHGLVKATPRGAALLSGGEFGAEGSILTVVICTGIAAWFTRRAILDGRIVKPFWRRDRVAWPASEPGVMEARAAAADLVAPDAGNPMLR